MWVFLLVGLAVALLIAENGRLLDTVTRHFNVGRKHQGLTRCIVAGIAIVGVVFAGLALGLFPHTVTLVLDWDWTQLDATLAHEHDRVQRLDTFADFPCVVSDAILGIDSLEFIQESARIHRNSNDPVKEGV